MEYFIFFYFPTEINNFLSDWKTLIYKFHHSHINLNPSLTIVHLMVKRMDSDHIKLIISYLYYWSTPHSSMSGHVMIHQSIHCFHLSLVNMQRPIALFGITRNQFGMNWHLVWKIYSQVPILILYVFLQLQKSIVQFLVHSTLILQWQFIICRVKTRNYLNLYYFILVGRIGWIVPYVLGFLLSLFIIAIMSTS